MGRNNRSKSALGPPLPHGGKLQVPDQGKGQPLQVADGGEASSRRKELTISGV